MQVISGSFSNFFDKSNLTDEIDYNNLLSNYPHPIFIFNQKKEIKFRNKSSLSIISESENTIPDILTYQTEDILYENGEHYKIYIVPLNSMESSCILINNSEYSKLVSTYDHELKNRDYLLAKLIPEKFICNSDNNSSNEKMTNFAMIMCLHLNNITDPEKVLSVYTTLYENKKSWKNINYIKCFGNNFLVFWGIFDDIPFTNVNYIREMIDYSIDVSNDLKGILSNTDYSIGIEASGPVLSGIIELDVPVYEVFGNSIESAQELSLSAQPNTIHISRSLYEKIFDKYNIRERGGDLKLLKQGNNQTYSIILS